MKQKIPIGPLVLILLAGIIYGGATLYHRAAGPEQLEPSTSTAAAAESPPTEKTKMLFTFDGIPSPFAILPTAVSGGPAVTVSQNLPAIPPLPSGLPLPSTPGKPWGPVSPEVLTLTVKGVFYKQDGANVAILSDGKEDLVVTEGQTRWGYVSDITKDNIVIDGKVIPYRREVSPAYTSNVEKIPALPVR